MNGFNQITATRLEAGNTKLDSGHLAELLLFYKSVNIVINKFMLDDLLSYCDLETLYELVKSKRLNIYIRDNYIGGAKYNEDRYNIQVYTAKGENYKTILYKSINKILNNSTKAVNWQDKFLEFVNPFIIAPEDVNMIREEFTNEDYIKRCLEKTIQYHISDYSLPNNTELRFESGEPFNDLETLKLITNYNFDEINSIFQKINVPAVVNPPSLLLSVSSSLLDLNVSNNFNSHVLSSRLSDNLIALKYDDIVNKNKGILDGIELFQEVIMPEYSKVGDIIRSKGKSFKDLLLILEKAEKFKNWLDNIDDNRDIINEYYNKISEKTWLQSIPGKISRLLIFVASGPILDAMLGAPVISLVLSTIDQFLIEKIGNGWKPNRFIDDELKPFLS